MIVKKLGYNLLLPISSSCPNLKQVTCCLVQSYLLLITKCTQYYSSILLLNRAWQGVAFVYSIWSSSFVSIFVYIGCLMYNYLSPLANSLCLVTKVGRAKSANLYAQLCACPIWILCVPTIIIIIIIIQFLSYYMMQNHEYMLASGIMFHGLVLFLLDEILFCITNFVSLIAWNLNWNEFKSPQVGSVTLLPKFVSAENLVQDLLKLCKIFLCSFK